MSTSIYSTAGHSTNGDGSRLVQWPSRYPQVVGWGMQVPERVVTNAEIAHLVKIDPEKIRELTGIEERRIVSDPKETTASLAIEAANAALHEANVSASLLDMVICATSSPDFQFPATASLIQDSLGAIKAGACDLGAGCSGLVYGLAIARAMILAGDAEYILVVGADTISRFVDWTDFKTCTLFGDGAGAILLAASEKAGGVLSCILGSDGSGGGHVIMPGGGSANPTTMETVTSGQHFVKMNGPAVFRFATRIMAETTQKVVAKAGLSLQEIDLVIPHQANLRIIESSVQKRLMIPTEKVFTNIKRYGNTNAASIPIALCDAIEAGLVSPGKNLVFVGFGAGLTWAATTVNWGASIS